MEGERRQRWWQTLPGMLTAIAGFITAVTGLIVAIHQIAPHRTASGSGGTAASTSPVETTAPRETTPPTQHAPRYGVTFPSGTRATFFGGGLVYDLLRATAARSNPGELQLKLRLRMTNNGGAGANFWNQTFRLLVDGIPRTPTNFLDDVVDGHSAGDGEVDFAVPERSRRVVLRLIQQDKTVQLPVAIRPR